MKQIIYALQGGETKRFHTVPTLNEQTVGQHSFGVAWLCEWLTAGNASKQLIMAALAHDLAEQDAGDVPSPAKRAMSIGNNFHCYEWTKLTEHKCAYSLSPADERTLKFADMLEGLCFCLKERTMGNKRIVPVYNNFYRYISEMDPSANALILQTFINKEWEKYND